MVENSSSVLCRRQHYTRISRVGGTSREVGDKCKSYVGDPGDLKNVHTSLPEEEIRNFNKLDMSRCSL